MRVMKFLLAIAVLAALLPAATSAANDGCPDVAPPQLEFGAPTYVDANRAGGEPVIIAAEDGSLNMSAHAGTTHAYKDPKALGGVGDFAVGYYNQTLNWRSVDDGKTWSYVGTAGLHEGPHSALSTGFSDPGYAMDKNGNLYNVEIDLANIAVFVSNDDGQSWNISNPEITAGDRPWMVAGDEPNEAFLYVRTPAQLWRTDNAGLTWLPVKLSGLGIYGQIYPDPLVKDGLIGPRSGDSKGGFGISADDGVTWKNVAGPDFTKPGDQIFAPIDVDKADGTVYMAQGNGYTGPADKTPDDGFMEFNFYDREKEAWGLEAPQRLPIPAGDVLWPWMVAGENGRVAMAWYHSFPEAPEDFHLLVAQTTNAKGSHVDCDGDGTNETYVAPQWTVANASGRPVHRGEVCLQGTTCNANTNFVAGDRRLGDFFQINYDRDGDLIIASADTMLKSVTGGPKPVANPIFIGQTGGAKMLENPLPVRKTRCLGQLPICNVTKK